MRKWDTAIKVERVHPHPGHHDDEYNEEEDNDDDYKLCSPKKW